MLKHVKSEIPCCVTLVDFTQQRQTGPCNGFGLKCRTKVLKSPALRKIALQERAKKAWAKAEVLWEFLPWACCLSELVATAWVHELPRSHALPSPFLCCLLIFFCKAPPSYTLQFWLPINCLLRTGLVIWTINGLGSEGTFHLWVGDTDPTCSSNLGKSLAPDFWQAAGWNVLGTLIPPISAPGTVSPATMFSQRQREADWSRWWNGSSALLGSMVPCCLLLGVTSACSCPLSPASICGPDRLTWACAQHQLYLRWTDGVKVLAAWTS